MKLYWQISKSFCLLYMLLLSGSLNFAVPCNLYPCWGRKSSQTRTTGRKRSGISRPIRAVRGSKPGVQTNSEGKFNLRRTKKVRWVWAMDPYHRVAVCIRDGDRRYTGWAESGLGYTPASLSLDCDLENNISIRTTAGLACVIYTRREPKRKSD